MAYNAVTVSDTATLIVAANSQRLSLIIVNNGSNTIYIGQDTSVSATNGTPIFAGSSLTEDSGGTKMYCGPIYGITASSTSNTRYWERIS